jgi:hypothetical protein
MIKNYIVTCKTPGCIGENVSLPQTLDPYSYIDPETDEQVIIPDENGNAIYTCYCGPCGNLIEDLVEVVE